MKKKDFQEALKIAGYMRLTLTFYEEIVPQATANHAVDERHAVDTSRIVEDHADDLKVTLLIPPKIAVWMGC